MPLKLLQIEMHSISGYINIFENIGSVHDKILKCTAWPFSICITFQFRYLFPQLIVCFVLLTVWIVSWVAVKLYDT